MADLVWELLRCVKSDGDPFTLIQWFRSLPRRWRLALVWIPSWGLIMGVISWVTLEDSLRVPAGIVVGSIIGVSSYVHVIRSGGW
jgi:hypothetical protein